MLLQYVKYFNHDQEIQWGTKKKPTMTTVFLFKF